MGDGAEQPLPVVDEAANALLHDVEGAGRCHDFGGTLLFEGRLVDVLAEVDRCLGEATQGAGLPAHQHEGEEAEEDRHQGDETHLVARHHGVIQCHVGGGQQGRQIEPLPRFYLDLGHQHRRIDGLQRQGVAGPGGGEVRQQGVVVEDVQLLGAGEIHLDRHGVGEFAAEHLLHLFEHQRLALAVGDGADVDLFLVQGDEEAAAPHVAQLIQGDVAVLQGQGLEEVDGGSCRQRQVAGGAEHALQLPLLDLLHPDASEDGLGEQDGEQQQQQHPRQQGAGHQGPPELLPRHGSVCLLSISMGWLPLRLAVDP